MKLRNDINDFLNTLPTNIHLVAVTKYVDVNVMKSMYSNDIKCFGENRVEDFLEKYEKLNSFQDIDWHFIGHLQRNKASKVINKINCLHSLDSLLLADIIEKERTKPLDCFVEVSVNLEETKNGVPYNEVEDFIKKLKEYKKVNIKGLMMMAIKGSSKESLIKQFSKLVELRDNLEKKLDIPLKELSMGMSNDYLEAIECGSTYIRLGRILYEE